MMNGKRGERIYKVVNPNGNGAHVIVPKRWIGSKVLVEVVGNAKGADAK